VVTYTLTNNTGTSTFGSGTINVPAGAVDQSPIGTYVTLGTTSDCCADPYIGTLYYTFSWTNSQGISRPNRDEPNYSSTDYCAWASLLPVEGSPSLPTFTLTLS
jgi:hypothetical protein